MNDISPLSVNPKQTFERYRFLVHTVLLRYPLLRRRNTKIGTVLENLKCGFVPGQDNFDRIEVSKPSVHRQ